jgi:hypothetical protein
MCWKKAQKLFSKSIFCTLHAFCMSHMQHSSTSPLRPLTTLLKLLKQFKEIEMDSHNFINFGSFLLHNLAQPYEAITTLKCHFYGNELLQTIQRPSF